MQTRVPSAQPDHFVHDRLPAPEAYLDLPAAPESLLRPLVGDEHGGQVILMYDGDELISYTRG